MRRITGPLAGTSAGITVETRREGQCTWPHCGAEVERDVAYPGKVIYRCTESSHTEYLHYEGRYAGMNRS